MPSLEESRREVRESLDKQAQEPDHEDILASLQDEIDKHNAVKDELRRTMRRDKRRREDEERTPEPAMKFRFKASTSDPRKRKHRSRNDEDGLHRKHRKHDLPTPPEEPPEEEATHPFPREPANADQPPPTDNFQDSLFDALADDEGAQYWESVYSQPIHVYPRPTVETPKGELEQMSDEKYAAYVKTKMWERKHPEVVIERERTKRLRKEEEEEKTRRREEFVRRKEQAAWEQAERKGARRYGQGTDEEDEKAYEHHVPGEWDASSDSTKQKKRQSEYTAAWSRYLAAWDKLKHDLLGERSASEPEGAPPSKRIPWPVLRSKPVIRANIESFLRHAPADTERTTLQLLKAERVRWHPDKVQQRFSGKVDDLTMKLVTGVFQVVDSLFEGERKRVE
ncbi:hypothetical protein LTR36_001835 [Oleoguttula mirabilis]|uniref:NF-kappa-B inhibitor-like protein 1 n=1 Tax=Oleoguttula mirabilis TaxID=1507867 RepID=A0AAV9JM61_9PEZI|nr:hypothetical protein LTR36_001835 [Oleoguttula mirabilis]